MKEGKFKFLRPNLNKIVVLLAIVIFCLMYYKLLLGREVFTHDAIIWYGSFHYYVDSIAQGNFPYWDPYLMAGTYFYPNISGHGLLEPIVLFLAFSAKIFGLSPITLYIYFRLFRLIVFTIGAFYFFEYITKSRISALLSAIILFFSMPPSYFKQPGVIDVIYLTPFALYFLLLFLENPGRTHRYLYLFCIVFITGISMNIYIPAFYFFNLLIFLIGLLVLKIVRPVEVARSLLDRKLAVSLILALVVIVAMAAPPLMVMSKEMSDKGEIFPMIRIIQKSEGNIKKIMASEVKTPSLSDKYTSERALFSSYGNMANLLYPDSLQSLPFFANHDFMSEADQYIGIIPFLLCILGVMYHKSRYKYLGLIMIIIILINYFSYYGFYTKPYNLLQRAFNEVFPPLKMINVRETLSSYFLFYLCMLSSMGFSILFDEEGFLNLIKKRYPVIVAICLVIILSKIIITGTLERRFIFASTHDLFVLFQLVFLAAFIYLYRRGLLTQAVFYTVIVAVILTDLAYYNKDFKSPGGSRMLQDSSSIYSWSTVDSGNGFQYFREPVVDTPGIAFGESISKMKGALTYGNNHSFFTTKRYYDLLTHVPLQNQFALNGIVYPIVQFFPLDRVIQVNDKRDLLNFYLSSGIDDIHRYLFIENPASERRRTIELGDLKQYESLSWFQPWNIINFYNRFLSENMDYIKGIRENLDQYLRTPLYSITVKDFSINEVTIYVRNVIDGYFYYNDGWSRYWQAYDGDKEIPVQIANYNSKAVYLGKGEHLIRFVFNPIHYKIGLILYYSGMLLALAMIVFFYIKGRRKEQNIIKADRRSNMLF